MQLECFRPFQLSGNRNNLSVARIKKYSTFYEYPSKKYLFVKLPELVNSELLVKIVGIVEPCNTLLKRHQSLLLESLLGGQLVFVRVLNNRQCGPSDFLVEEVGLGQTIDVLYMDSKTGSYYRIARISKIIPFGLNLAVSEPQNLFQQTWL